MNKPINRRAFLAGAGALGLAACAPESNGEDNLIQPFAEQKGLSILQGYTTQTTTQLSIDIEKSVAVVYTLTDIDTKRVVTPASVKPNTYGSNKTRVDKVKFEGLELGHKYSFVVTETKKKKVLDERILSTVDLNKHGARIALMSCMNDGKSAMSKMWSSAQAANIDYTFFLGDAVYGDLWIFHGPDRLWSRFVETRKNIPFYRWKNLKPVIAVWDDHDFGKNNGDGGYKTKDHSHFIFNAFFAQEPDNQSLFRGYANSSYLEAFGQNFVLFDNRYYRSQADGEAAGKEGFLGRKQIDWMSNAVTSRPNPTWVMQGSPVWNRDGKDSYQGTAPEELDYLLSKVKSWGPSFFAAGNLHFSEVSAIDKSALGYGTFEVISSCMHSNTKKEYYPQPNARLNGYLKENFLILEQTGLRGDPVWKIECVSKDMTLPFSGVLEVG